MKPSANIPASDFDVSRWGELPPYRGLFVTGTDTGVGKTMVAGAIARSLRRRGRSVDVFKPAATGCRRAGGQLVSEDAEFLAGCANSMRMLSEIAPVRYATAVVPNVAAELERRPVDLSLIFDAYKRIDVGRATGCTREKGSPTEETGENGDRRHSQKTENGASPHSPFVVVEGVGGLLCPISDEFWVIHLAKMMALPLVVVARAGLGTINHTLLTLHAARSAGLTVAGVVLNRYRIDPISAKKAGEDALEEMQGRGDVDMAMYTNPRQIEERGRTKVLALVPEEAASSVERVRVGPDVQFAIDQVDWEKLAMGLGKPRL